ncbi:MAG TPA: hypothetical protein PKK06_10720 [Phycisphaerae bacterium]|nr:hypothetical protein [Phycisphaerae bacterium]HNU44959.1 hypothetical protein [Phycisphaerae bacterium]
MMMQFASRRSHIRAGLALAGLALIVWQFTPPASGQGVPPGSAARPDPAPPPAAPAKRTWAPVGTFSSSAICECSGLARSRRHPGVFWTHNDSGNPPELFAVKLTGELVGRVLIADAVNEDWEDIAIDDRGHIFIGDLGDNFAQYGERVIYELLEPETLAERMDPIKPLKVWKLRYPEQHYDCEALFVRGRTLYIIPKLRRQDPPLLRLDPAEGDRLIPHVVGHLPVRMVTAADVSDEGRTLAVLTYGRLLVFPLGDELADLGRTTPRAVSFPARYQTEACAFDGGDVIVAAESKEIFRVTAEDIALGTRFVNAP